MLTGSLGNQTSNPRTQVFRVEPGQPVVAIAGAGQGAPYTLPGGPALTLPMTTGSSMAFNREGVLAIATWQYPGALSSIFIVRPAAPGFSLSQYLVASRDRSEQYVFDVTGRHLRTLDALTDGTRYAFYYGTFANNTKVLLHAIYDMNGDSTIIHRNSAGDPDYITAPDGQVTSLQLSGGYLSSVTNPTGTQTTQLFPRSSNGLLDSLQDARGYSHRFQYEADGRLSLDRAADGFSTALTTAFVRDDSLPDREIHSSSSLNRPSSYVVDFRDARQTEIRKTRGPDNLEYVTTKGSDETVTQSSPDGSSLSSTPTPDPRYGMQAPYAGSLTAHWPATGTSTITTSRTYNSGTREFTSTATVNSIPPRSYAMAYTVAPGPTRTVTLTPPVTTRVVTGTVDSVGRPLTMNMPGTLADVVTRYDTRGRVDTLWVGTRGWGYHYEDARGRLTRIVDPLNRTTRFQYDEADRLQWQVLPGGTDTVYFEHDPGGNLTGLKPPGKPFHRFALTPGELTRQYDPPDVPGLARDTTHYEFDADRELTRFDRPDNQSVDLGYDGTGRLATVTQPRGTATLTYHPSGNGAGQPATLSSPDGVALTFGYDGNLPNSEGWNFGGGVTGSVSYQYDLNLWPTRQTVTPSSGAASDVSYGFDLDGLVTSATVAGGAVLKLVPNTITSVLDSSRVSGLAMRYGHNPYAELTSSAAWYGADSLLAERYDRDNLGRITRLVETTASVTTDRGYSYALPNLLTHPAAARKVRCGRRSRRRLGRGRGPCKGGSPDPGGPLAASRRDAPP